MRPSCKCKWAFRDGTGARAAAESLATSNNLETVQRCMRVMSISIRRHSASSISHYHSTSTALIALLHPVSSDSLPADQLRVAMASRATTLLVVMVAVAHLAFGTNAFFCDTFWASPTESDANDCVQYISNLVDTNCCQLNCQGDFCTQMRASGGARVLICGPCNACTSCSTASNALNTVLDQCARNIGGTDRCSGIQKADGFNFVIGVNRGVEANATNEVVQTVLET